MYRSPFLLSQATIPYPVKIGFSQHTHPVAAPVSEVKKSKKHADDVYIAFNTSTAVGEFEAIREGMVTAITINCSIWMILFV